ncbi:MAG: 3-deoxy-D-manno-octulosonic acid transferase [Marinovum sp.]|nr:3-deoxy-D-manno-octulosonic acid transferase [Marinovum sp.]
MHLAQRLMIMRGDVHVLLTAPADVAPPRHLPPGIVWVTAPQERRDTTALFMAHFDPEICLWSTGDLRPFLIDAAFAQECPVALIDAREDALGSRGLLRWAHPLQALLRGMHFCFASDDAASARLERLGVATSRKEVLGPLRESGAAMTANERVLDALSETIGVRPVWLAAMVQPQETATVLCAHRQANRFSQRLLLILVPEQPDMADGMAERADQVGLRIARWSAGEFPDDRTDVLLADTLGEMGLWYRLAAVSFMGSSLVAGVGGCDPFEPAALGSAILYGPNCGRHLEAYSKLVDAGAARMVRDTDSLTAALKYLSGPDRAANMALAAWDLVSRGAAVVDRIVDLAQDMLDDVQARERS